MTGRGIGTAVIGGIVHESSTMAAEVTGEVGLDDFTVVDGDAVRAQFAGTATCVGGYLAACAEAGVTAVPILHARAEPAGTVAGDGCRELTRRLLAGLRAAPDPGLVLLDLHGAGVVGAGESLDARVLAAVRAAVPAGTLIVVTMDLHANVTPDILAPADVVVGYQRYPHTDIAARAHRAAGIGIAAARGTAVPVVRCLRLPMVLPPVTTEGGPGRALRELVETREERTGVLACTVFHGFPYADTEQAGCSVVTVSDGDPGIADQVNAEVGYWLWHHRERFLHTAVPPAEAVATALAAGGPVVIADAADNPGGGGVGDGTYLLRAILEREVSACFATLHDPAAVTAAAAAGVGATVDLVLGGRHGPVSGDPIRCRARIRAVTDGRVVNQSMQRGRTVDFGLSVRLLVGAADVIVAANRVQVFDPEIFRLHGVLPERYPLIAVKSAHHFRSGFAAVTDRMLVADAPGLTTRQIERLRRSGPSARLWPLHDREDQHGYAVDVPLPAAF